MFKCSGCGGERFIVTEEGQYECVIKEGKLELVESYGFDYKNLRCLNCDKEPKIDISEFEVENKF